MAVNKSWFSGLRPSISGILLKKIIAEGLGKLGGGLEIYVVDGKSVNRCQKGSLWVNYMEERYEYQTPLPGCL